MSLANWLLLFVGAYAVVGAIALAAEISMPGLFRPARPTSLPPRRPVARPRPARWAVASYA